MSQIDDLITHRIYVSRLSFPFTVIFQTSEDIIMSNMQNENNAETVESETLSNDFKKRWLKELHRPGISRVMAMRQTARRRRFRIMATCLDAEFRDVELKWKEERERNEHLNMENEELRMQTNALHWQVHSLTKKEVSET